jgi:hypothetical protein
VNSNVEAVEKPPNQFNPATMWLMLIAFSWSEDGEIQAGA